ncbi:hypothetical protein [Motiliproteus sediminis]|uniref:hypothetical protein n=1 Tax=Motiliproteus sediminis TaxID=1468178 RepID=UPI001AEF86D0|nr:hypothetical protein [Motiliproteus sediminis]
MRRFASLISLMVLPIVAQAEGVYLYGAVGGAEYGFSQNDAHAIAQSLVEAGARSASVYQEAAAGMFKLGIGVPITRFFAVEGGYTDLGSLHLSGMTTGPASAFDAKQATSGYELALIGIHSLSSATSFFARVGAYAWETAVDARISDGLAVVDARRAVDGADLTFGFGLQYADWRLEYQRYSLDRLDVDTFQIGYRF